MLALSILCLGLILHSVLLLRACRTRTVTTYKWFYAYIFAGLIADIALYLALGTSTGRYAEIYWTVQFATLALGCGIILEIFKHVLAAYPGAEKFATSICVTTFGVIFLFGIVYARLRRAGTRAIYVELERDVRSAQILFVVAIIAVILYYGIPLGANMRGMICGYAVYLFVSVITLALGVYIGHRFNAIWLIAQPLSFDVSLFIWLIALWAYHPNPAPARELAIESDYEALAELTRERLSALRAHFVRTIRI